MCPSSTRTETSAILKVDEQGSALAEGAFCAAAFKTRAVRSNLETYL